MITLWWDILDFDGQVLETFPLEQPTLTYKLSDKGECDFGIAFSNPALSQLITIPKGNDYRVKVSTDRGLTSDPIQGGICGPVALKTGDDFVRIKGYDYLYWLEQPFHFTGYPIDPLTWGQDDIIKFWVQDTQQNIIQDILDGMYDGTNETLQLNADFNGTGWLEQVDAFYIIIGDTTNVIDIIRNVGGLIAPYGFDFWCDYDKLIRFYAPRRLTVENANPFVVYTPDTLNGLLEIDWDNQGPLNSSSVGMPSAALMKYFSYAPARTQFRNWLEILELGDYIRTDFTAQQATNDIGGLHSNPQKKNTITVLPELMDPFDETVGFYNQCGRVVYVESSTEFYPYHKIQAPYTITEQSIFMEDATWKCRLTLDQIYAVD